MLTECSRELFGYEVVEGRQVVAAVDGGDGTTDAGGLLLGAANRAIGLCSASQGASPTAARRRWWSIPSRPC